MSESNKPFVVTDRRKFTKDGELRPDAPHSSESPAQPAPVQAEVPAPPPVEPPPPSQASAQPPAPQTLFQVADPVPEEDQLPAPTAEQTAQSRFAYEQTADRLETAIRAANPGADHAPPMDFEGLVQSFYLTAIMQLGGATQEGEKPRVDILGARQSIDMLAVLGDKTKGNLTPSETRLLESALFELRMAFLDVTQAIARSAAARGNPASPRPGGIVL